MAAARRPVPRRVETVTWLLGAQTSQPLLTEVLTDRGLAFKVARDDGVLLADIARPEHILIGTKSHTREDWHNLTECKMTPTGLWTPSSDRAFAEHIAWLRRPPTDPIPARSGAGGGIGGPTRRPKAQGKVTKERDDQPEWQATRPTRPRPD